MAEKELLVSACVLFRTQGDTVEWFLVKQDEKSEWDFARSVARVGESSVRAGIRAMAEQGGMRVKVLEEVGRSGGATKVNGRPVTQRTLYYLMELRGGGEILGFTEVAWFEYRKALNKFTSKKDIQMFKDANKLLKVLEKQNKVNVVDENEIPEE